MPVLSDDMYCSEQICIPPTFPYLLRQYAKAAIRTQPTDLLKWSTAYFRCLSLNIPPPVKPRLEYPIPRDFNGLTPGWIKALMYQLQNNPSIPFKILWDRWIGACLQHHTLIQLLCLGGFDNPLAIPWLKFIAICAGTLCDDLTQTMILICEILTEEPEGSSAMVSLETFIDLYKYLAKIDASNGQILRNYYFRDSLLSLWRAKVEKEELKQAAQEEITPEREESHATISTVTAEEGEKLDEAEKVVSCPSLPEDDHFSIDYLLQREPYIEGESTEDVELDVHQGDESKRGSSEIKNGKEAEKEGEIFEEQRESVKVDKSSESDENEGKDDKEEEQDTYEQESEENVVEIEEVQERVKEDREEIEEEEVVTETINYKEEEQYLQTVIDGDGEEEAKEYESVETIIEQPVRDLEHIFEDDANLQEDLERLKALQQELAGETDEEIEKFKCRLIEEMPLTQSQEDGIKHFRVEKLRQPTIEGKLKVVSAEDLKDGDVTSDSQETEEDKRPYDDIYVEAIRGIGGVVPDHLIQAVVEYMKNCAKIQHGMVMPRNIRHYNCPPLEEIE